MDILQKLAALFRKPDQATKKGRKETPVLAQPNAPKSPATRGDIALRQICNEALDAVEDFRVKLSNSSSWVRLKAQDADFQIAVMMAAVERMPRGAISYTGQSWQMMELHKSIISQILQRSLSIPNADLCELLKVWLNQRYSLEHGFPGRALLGAIERQAESGSLDPSVLKLLRRIRDRALRGDHGHYTPNKFAQQVADRIANLLDPSTSETTKLPEGPFATAFLQGLTGLPAQAQSHWRLLAVNCADAGDKPKPSGKWLSAASTAIAPIERAQVVAQISRAMDGTTPDPGRPDASLDILKGLVWTSTLLDHDVMAGQVGRFAEKCFRKVPNLGARSVKLGNAALWALSEMAGEPRAAAELFRLREKIKYPSARKLIDNRLDELARKNGQTIEEMEDASLPTFGLDASGAAHFDFRKARAEIQVQATETSQLWFSGAGTRTKSIPTEVRANFAQELASFRQAAKDIEAERASQVLRLEQSWVENREWSFEDWRRQFLDHPLRRAVVTSLIWRLDDQVLLPRGNALVDVLGNPHAIAPDARIRLWHPLDSRPEEVLAWRQRILDLGITQPIKQSHREIYVLTDAERVTATYSNRFAAHILRQHQFRALCQARGWKYDLMGGWDGWNVPTRHLPKQNMSVEYQVEIVDNGQHSDAWVSLHLASDQVRFLDARGRPVELETIAPIVFSELLRDVDLFVAVTSVANDPTWGDGGPNGRHGGYWTEWAFGDLGQSAATRRELVGWLAPKLSIADKLQVTDKFLIVQGKRQKYAIHFGSSNIQILPGNRYLCIVPDRAPAEATRLKLPFTGDGLLSTILSKAFLLVDEDKIRDETILRQL